MKVALFKNLNSKKWFSPSMDRYETELEKNLKFKNLEVRGIQPKPPFFLNFLPDKLNFYLARYQYYPFLAARQKAAVYHILDQSLAHLIFSLERNKTIITCHDLIPLKVEKDEFSLKLFKKSIAGLKEARFIIADSEATKKDIMENLRIQDEKIKVVYLGVEEKFKPVVDPTLLAPLKEKYFSDQNKIILHVGNNLPYKNIETLIKALAQLKKLGVSFTFLKVGSDFNKTQKELLKANGLEKDTRIITNLTDEELPLIYNLATVLVYPSLYEGFGFPVLEAMACGVPVICSKNASLAEVGGGAVLYAKANDSLDIACKIKEVFESLSLKQGLIEKGLKQANKFTWEKTAAEVLKIYEEIASD